MYFDGQLSYLDKDKQPSTPIKPSLSENNATSSTPSQPSQPLPSSSTSSSTPNVSIQKAQTVSGAAGDLHSMALKSAISNIGSSFLKICRLISAPHFVKRPSLQKRMLSAASPSELLRTTLSPSDISFRQITYLPDELLYDIPETGDSALSLFQGFRASLPDASPSMALRKGTKSHSHHKRSQSKVGHENLTEPQRLQRERDSLVKDLEIITIRKVIRSSDGN